MIIYNEKVEGEASQSPATPTLPQSTNATRPSVDTRVGLLHQYLQRYNQTTKPIRRTSGDTSNDDDVDCCSKWDEPPPYSASVDDETLSEKEARTAWAKAELPKAPRSLPPRFPSQPPSASASTSVYPPLLPPIRSSISDPSSSSSRQSPRDIHGSWVLSSDVDEATTASADDAAPSLIRKLETYPGNIHAQFSISGSRRARCRIEAVARCGSINLRLDRIHGSAARIHATASSSTSTTIHLPHDFTGVVRLSQLPTSSPFDPQLRPTITLIQNFPREYFVGDVTAAGYIKGEAWAGDLVECDGRGSVSILRSDPPPAAAAERWDVAGWVRRACTFLGL